MFEMNEQYPVIIGAESFFFKGNSIGILISHGFVGTPQSVRVIGEELARLGYSVLAPRLKGHGTHYNDLENCTRQDWFHSLESGYHQLRSHCSTIFVLGQSMGGTLALQLAKKYEEIAGLIIINSALTIPSFNKYRHQTEPRFIPEGKPDIKADHVYEITYDYTPLTAIHELQQLMDETLSILPDIKQPIIAMKSSVDHVVPPRNTEYIMEKVRSNIKQLITLEHSYHVASLDYDQANIIHYAQLFLEQHSKQVV